MNKRVQSRATQFAGLNPFLIRESFELQSKILAFKINGLKPLILVQNQGKKADEILIKLLNNFLANSSLAIYNSTKFS